MSAPFPEQDFLAGTWRTLDEIAEKSHGECSFDTFAIWCLAYHAGDRFDQLGGKLNGLIEMSGR